MARYQTRLDLVNAGLVYGSAHTAHVDGSAHINVHHEHSTGFEFGSVNLADATALTIDCGEAGTADAACAAARARATAAGAMIPRRMAHRDEFLEHAGTIAKGECSLACCAEGNCSMRRSSCLPLRPPGAATNFSGTGNQASGMRTVVTRLRGSPTIATYTSAHRQQQAGASYSSLRVTQPKLNQYEQHRQDIVDLEEFERQKRASRNRSLHAAPLAGDPIRTMQSTVTRETNVDLMQLAPAQSPATQYVSNVATGDRYHRTSVYAASGVPIDVPTYSKKAVWAQRIQV